MLQILEIGGFILLVPLALLVGFYFWASAGSYPKDKYNEVVEFDKILAPTNQDTFTIITYNIGYLSGLDNAATSNIASQLSKSFYDENLETAVAALKLYNPDFIGFQEIDIASKRSYYVNQVTELANKLGFSAALIGINWDKNYVPFPLSPISAQFGRTLAAQAVLSRFPITQSARIVLEQLKNKPFYYKAFYLDRIAQVAQIDVSGKPLIIINVHLEAFDEATRASQTIKVKELAESYADKHPVLLIGDFNSSLNRASETNPSIKLLLESDKLKSAFSIEQLKSKNNIGTYPSDELTYTFDYIFYNSTRIEFIESRVITEAKTASDHVPIMVRFRLL
jgi:endonuclease/exonuclease/phosphatase family metal-dependent hydrolase